MNLNEAIEKCFEPEVYSAMKNRISPPEMLKAAALQCFLHNQEEGVEDKIRTALIILDATGMMMKD